MIYTKASLETELAQKIKVLLAKKEDLKLELSSIKSFLKEIVTKRDGEELLTILLAEELKTMNKTPILDTRAAGRILHDLMPAAKFLVTYDLV